MRMPGYMQKVLGVPLEQFLRLGISREEALDRIVRILSILWEISPEDTLLALASVGVDAIRLGGITWEDVKTTNNDFDNMNNDDVDMLAIKIATKEL